jgi:GT2 family glycosyltransferase
VRVLLICRGWADDPAARWLAKGLAAVGDRLAVVALEPRGGRGLVRRVAEPGFDVAFLGGASTALDVQRAVEQLLSESRVDLAHLLSLEGPLALLAAPLDAAGIPLVLSANGEGWALSPEDERRLCGRFARVLAGDAALAERFVEAGVDPLRISPDAAGPSPWGLAPPGFDDGLQPVLRAWGEVLEERARRPLPPKDRLIAVVLHERGFSQTLAAVRALEGGQRRPDALIVVDQAPWDGGASFLRAALSQAQVLEVDARLGFAAGANAGLARALALGADRVFFLSGEVEVQPDTLARLEGALVRHGELGVVGPLLRSKSSPGTVVTDGMRWSPRSGRVKHPGKGKEFKAAPEWELKQVDGLSSLAMLVTRHALDEVGLFDLGGVPGLLALDFCIRARAKGKGVAALPSASAFHNPAAPEGGALKRLFDARAQFQLVQQHAPRPALPALARGAAIVASHAVEVVEKRAPRRARPLFALARAAVAAVRS